MSSARQIGAERLHLVYGHGAELLRRIVAEDVNWVLQAQRLGTGRAGGAAAVPGTTRRRAGALQRTPLIQPGTCNGLLAAKSDGMALLTVVLD